MDAEKIQRISVTDQIFEVLVKKISDGEWKTGEKIPSEIELSQQLGVSRVSLKIALQRLNTLGVTETRIGEGTYVCEFNLKNYFAELINNRILNIDVNQINEFRILLEYCAMYLTITKPEQPEKIACLERTFDKMSVALNNDDYQQYDALHFQFHRIICEMSENVLFLQIFDSVSDMLFHIYKQNSERTWKALGKSESITHHQQIVDALKNRDVDRITVLQRELLSDEIIR